MNVGKSAHLIEQNMNIAASPVTEPETLAHVAAAVRAGLTASPKHLPPCLFYDEAGSRLFEQITTLDEYYLTRTERGILARHAGEIVSAAAQGGRLRIAELGAGSAEKTRLLLSAAAAQQDGLIYEPIDVSPSALDGARERIEREIPGVRVAPQVMDYTRGLALDPAADGERRLVLFIGSSIGNFEPDAALRLLRRVRASLATGDSLLLGVDLVKAESTLLAAYNDRAGVTGAFNRNLLARLNRELGADFDLAQFTHRALWNAPASRMEMHLESLAARRVRLTALNLAVDFAAGETLHTENCYKYKPGEAQALLAAAGFASAGCWTDEREWFAVCLGRAV